MDVTQHREQSQPKTSWTPSHRALPEQQEDSEFTASLCPSPAALSKRTLEASRQLEEHFNREIIFLIMRENGLKNVTGFSNFLVEAFGNHRDKLPKHGLIVLDTLGGCGRGAFDLARLLQQTCESHIVLIPKRGHSAGTLFSLSGDELLLSPEASLSPIDPQLNGRSSLAIHGSKDYVQDVLGGIATAIRAYDHEHGRPYAETSELLAHVMTATNVPELSKEWAESWEALLSVKDYAVKLLLKAKSYPHAEAENIATHLVFGYHDHNHKIKADELQAIGIKNVRVMDRATQGLVDNLWATLPLDYPIVGMLKRIDDDKPGESSSLPPRPRRNHLGGAEGADPAPISNEGEEA